MFNPFDIPIKSVYGPYLRKYKNGAPARRQIVIKLTDGRVTSMSFARWLMIQKLRRSLSETEHVDHIDENPKNDSLENFQILAPEANARKSGLGKPSKFKGQDRGWEHGTITYGWMKKKCECQLCAAAKRAWYNERNKARRAERSP